MRRVHESRTRILVWIFAIVMVLGAQHVFAANNPGHDSLYVLKIGDNMTGNLNLTGNLTAFLVQVPTRLFGPNLDIQANGSPSTGTNSLVATTTDLKITSAGIIYLADSGGTVVQAGTGSQIVKLNVSGDIYSRNTLVCLANGSNCVGTGSSNLTLAQIATNMGNWSADKPSYATLAQLNSGVGQNLTYALINTNMGNASKHVSNCGPGTVIQNITATGIQCTAASGVDTNSGYTQWQLGSNTGTTSAITNNTLVNITGAGSITTTKTVNNISIDVTNDAIDGAELADTITLDTNLAVNAYNVSFDGGTLFIDSTGNEVGIGTTTPSSLLHLYQDYAGQTGLRIENPHVAGNGGVKIELSRGETVRPAYLKFQNGTADEWYVGELYKGGNANTAFSIANGSDFDDSKIVILQTGNIGIGTIAPNQKLDVNGSINASGTGANIWVGSSRVCTETNGLCVTSVNYQSSAGGWTNTSTTTSTALDVNVDSGTLFADVSANNVGIGTTSPGSKLDVNGDLHLTTQHITGSAYHYTNGILIATDINATGENMMFELYIEGNSYGAAEPISTRIQGYNYLTTGTIINTAGIAEGDVFNVNVFHYNGYVYFWLNQTVSYQTYRFRLATNTGNKRITAITNAGYPAAGVTNDVNITPQKGWRSGNDGADSGLDADTIDGYEPSTTYVNRSLWTTIDNYPAACSAGQYVSALGDTLTCSTPSSTAYTAGYGLTLTGTQFNLSSATAGNGLTYTNGVLAVASHAGTAGSIGTVNIGADAIGVNLGTTSTTAYRGDQGETAYQHSQATANVHGLTFTGEGSGGGLDADTLDGQTSTFFINTSSTWTGGDLAGTGLAATVVDDSHNHIYSNIDATTSANWATIITDETGTGSIMLNNSPVMTTPTWAGTATGSISGNAGTATALAADPTDCSAGQAPIGITAAGAATGCTAYLTSLSGAIYDYTPGNWEIAANTNTSYYYDASLEVREYNNGGAMSGAASEAPRIAFHWGGRVASQIGMGTDGVIRTYNNPGTDYEGFRASTITGTTITASTQFSGPGTGLTGTAASLTAGAASALAANPADCGANTFATTIAANGALTCAAVTYAGISAMTSANLASIISDETGTGNVVFNTSPTISNPIFGGLVGIGATTPESPLHVVSTSFGQLRLDYSYGLNGPRGATFTVDSAGNLIINSQYCTVSCALRSITLQGNRVDIESSGGLNVTTGNIVVPTGKIGIGTTSPGAKLEVVGNILLNSTRPEIQLWTDKNSAARIAQYASASIHITNNLQYNGSTWNLDNTSAIGSVISSGNAGLLQLRYATPGANPRTLTDVMLVDTAGKVGIGTTPSSTLDVAGTGSFSVSTASNGNVLSATKTLTAGTAGYDENMGVYAKLTSTHSSQQTEGSYAVYGWYDNQVTGTGTTFNGQGVLGRGSATSGSRAITYLIGTAGMVDLSGSYSGTVTEARALSTSIGKTNGTITSAIGVYIGDNAGAGSSYNYGIYQTGSGDKNFFNGYVGIGNSNPGYALVVNKETNPVIQGLSGNSTFPTSIALGRTATDVEMAVAANTGHFTTSALIGDGVIRVANSSARLHLVSGTGQAAVTVSSTSVYNAGNTLYFNTVSDERLKTNITNLTGTLEQLNKLRPVTFNWKNASAHPSDGDNAVIGFIAQDVENVYPRWVSEGSDGYKTINPNGIDALLVAGVQEIDRKTIALEAENAMLKEDVVDLANDNAVLTTGMATLQEENRALKTAICRIAPDDQIC